MKPFRDYVRMEIDVRGDTRPDRSALSTLAPTALGIAREKWGGDFVEGVELAALWIDENTDPAKMRWHCVVTFAVYGDPDGYSRYSVGRAFAGLWG